jgi:hypothetical protein
MLQLAALAGVWISLYQTIDKILVPIWARMEWKRVNGND